MTSFLIIFSFFFLLIKNLKYSPLKYSPLKYSPFSKRQNYCFLVLGNWETKKKTNYYTPSEYRLVALNAKLLAFSANPRYPKNRNKPALPESNFMPIIAVFLGIIVRMFHNDHNPPHFHAQYGEYKIVIDAKTGKILGGKFPRRVLKLLQEWREQKHKEILAMWKEAQEFKSLWKISPLE